MKNLIAVTVAALATVGVPKISAQGVSPDTTSLGTTIRLVPGDHYRAGWFHRALLGDHYRDLWTDSLDVPLLDLQRFGGGLSIVCRGGGLQTKSLRLRNTTGTQYVFRSVDKDPSSKLPKELRQTFVADLLQDQISSHHPAGALVVAPLLDAAGVLHVTPRLAIMPKTEMLGDFRPSFGGVLGLFEERPRDGPSGTAGFGGSRRIEGTEYVWEKIETDPDHRIDARAFLRARLMDVFVGDWDRHYDQWRWARYPLGDGFVWRPIPRDRDQAFAQLDGMILNIARYYIKELVHFSDSYGSIHGLTWTGRALDRRFLSELDKPAWDSIAGDLQHRLSDSVIDTAVRHLPTAYYEANGQWLASALKRRRDDLTLAADRYYALLARQVDIHATDDDEIAEVTRLGNLGIRIVVRLAGGDRGTPIFERTFKNIEADEIRLYMRGGDDRVVLRGNSPRGYYLRIIGGGGDDVFVDSSSVDTGPTASFYDARGDVDKSPGNGISIDQHRFRPPEIPFPIRERPAGACGDSIPEAPPQSLFFPFRDWGDEWLPSPWSTVQPDLGVFVGMGAIRFGYGFRKRPFSSHSIIQAGYATGPGRFRVQYAGDFRRLAGNVGASLQLRYSGIDIVRFNGFGNATAAVGPDDFFKVTLRQIQFAPSLTIGTSLSARLAVGPRFRYARTILGGGNLIDLQRPYGSAPFAQLGVGADLIIDTRDLAAAPTRGIHLRVGAAAIPATLDVESSFAAVNGEISTFLTARRIAAEPTLALRVGGKKLFGTYPYHEAAYLGGATTLRGYNEQRFAGDAAVFGNAELRLFLTRYNVVLPGDFGIFGLADVGRVFFEGETSDRWHRAVGGGIWFAFIDRASTVSIAMAQSPENRLFYARAGFMF